VPDDPFENHWEESKRMFEMARYHEQLIDNSQARIIFLWTLILARRVGTGNFLFFFFLDEPCSQQPTCLLIHTTDPDEAEATSSKEE
jgi:hypothetical protein